MSQTKEQIVGDIDRYIKNNGYNFRNWYVGIAASPRARLFNDHSVQEYSDVWIYREAVSSLSARGIEDYFIKVAGTRGGTGGGDAKSRFVYAYKIRPHTRQ